MLPFIFLAPGILARDHWVHPFFSAATIRLCRCSVRRRSTMVLIGAGLLLLGICRPPVLPLCLVHTVRCSNSPQPLLNGGCVTPGDICTQCKPASTCPFGAMCEPSPARRHLENLDRASPSRRIRGSVPGADLAGALLGGMLEVRRPDLIHM